MKTKQLIITHKNITTNTVKLIIQAYKIIIDKDYFNTTQANIKTKTNKLNTTKEHFITDKDKIIITTININIV